MKVKLPSGVILESDNPTVTDQWVKAGFKEYAEKKTGKVKASKEE